MDNKKSFDDIVARRKLTNDTSDETLQTDYDREIIEKERNN